MRSGNLLQLALLVGHAIRHFLQLLRDLRIAFLGALVGLRQFQYLHLQAVLALLQYRCWSERNGAMRPSMAW